MNANIFFSTASLLNMATIKLTNETPVNTGMLLGILRPLRRSFPLAGQKMNNKIVNSEIFDAFRFGSKKSKQKSIA